MALLQEQRPCQASQPPRSRPFQGFYPPPVSSPSTPVENLDRYCSLCRDSPRSLFLNPNQGWHQPQGPHSHCRKAASGHCAAAVATPARFAGLEMALRSGIACGRRRTFSIPTGEQEAHPSMDGRLCSLNLALFAKLWVPRRGAVSPADVAGAPGVGLREVGTQMLPHLLRLLDLLCDPLLLPGERIGGHGLQAH